MNEEMEVKLGEIIELQNQIKHVARELQNSLVPFFGTNNPVIWANKLSKDELDSMRTDNARAYAMWGQEEEDLLAEMLEAGIELFVIAQALGRTESSLRSKVNKIRFD
jgi:hypothetical protein